MSNVPSMMESSDLQQQRLEEASSTNSEPSSSQQTLNSHKSELIIQCVNVVSSDNIKDNNWEERETPTITRSNSSKSAINKTTYLQLHRHSLSTGISSVNKLKGRYEGISKSTDNTVNANTTIHSKANVTENAELRKTVVITPSTSNDGSKGTFKSELTTKLFQPSQSEVSPAETKETTDANRVTANKIKDKNLEETPEQLLSKTKSNIEKLQNNLSTKLSSDTIEKLRNKYSPASFGYPKGGLYKRHFSEPSKIPLAKPKIAEKPKTIPEIKAVLVKEVLVLQDDVYKNTAVKSETAPIKEGIKDENSNVVIDLQHVESKTEDNVKAPTDFANSSKSLSDATDNSDISEEKSTSTFSCGLCKNEDSIPKENIKIHEKKGSDKLFSSHAVHTAKNDVNQDTDHIEEKEIPRSILKQPQIPETEHTDNIEIDVEYSKIEFANPEDKHFIVRRSSSEDSIYKIESLLDDFVMDKKPKEKKRSNSFRKLLTGGLFGRDKKKSDENKLKQKKDGGVSSENAHNESQLFDRNSSRRHTVDSSNSRRELQKNTNAISGTSHYQTPVTSYRRTPDEHDRYTEMSSSGSFVSNRPPKYSSEHYLPMGNGNSNNNKDIHLNRETVSKYIDTSSSSSNTIDFDRNSTYQNALIAQAEMRKIRESENGPNKNLEGKKHHSSPEMFRDNSSQAGNTSRNLQLVKPKALIPINSERPLPNPYHTKHEKLKNIDGYENIEIGQTLERNLNFDNSKPLSQKTNVYPKSDRNDVVFEDVYGTVFDCVSPRQQLENRNELGLRCISPDQKSPKSLESSKLKLPPNREKVDLQPRIRSPIPQAKVSTEKIIATELLKNKRSPSRSSTNLQEQSKDDSRYSSPTRPSSYQGSNIYENTFHFSEKASPNTRDVYPNSLPKMEDRIPELPKVKSNKHYLLAAEWHRKQREFDKSPAIETPQMTTNVMVHVNPSDENSLYNNVTPSSGTKKKNMQTSSPVPLIQGQASPRSINSSFNNLSLNSTYQQNSPSPSSKEDKQHMLQNVEAFYWRELRKLKDKEEQDILNYRRQQIQFYGYVEDPVLSRRSRSVSPNVQRGRRSLSLPRDVRPIQNPTRMAILSPEPIPEGRPVIAKKPIPLPTETSPLRQPLQKNPNFIRNSFERSTIGPIGVNKPYLPADGLKGNKQTGPIFKRGSLAVGEYSLENPYQLCKRVSFESNQNSSHPSSWPTKNGFTKSPPTRRIEREAPLDDEVFLPNGFQPNFSKRPGDLYEQRRVEREQYRTQQSMQGYPPHYGVIQRQVNYPERPDQDEPIYVSTGPKKITVSNKVCDIYGQIHDSKQNLSNSSKEYDRTRYQNQDNAINSQQYGQIRQSGLMYGQLKSPSVAYQSYNQLSTQPNFIRGTRLTASVNDMYRRYPYENVRVVDDRPPSDTRYFTDKSAPMPQRPLPPVPERRDSRAISVRKLIRGYAPISDNESGSEAGEVQRILQTGSKQNRINLAEEEWNSDGKSGRASGNESGGGRGDNEGEIKSGRSRSARREDPRRHTLSGDQHYSMAGQGGPLSRTMDLEGQFARGYPPSSNAMLFDDDPGIMSEVETSSTGFRRGGKQRSSLPVVRTPSKTLERPLGLVFLQYRNETKRALLPNEITSIDTVKALFVRSFPKQLSMEYLDSPLVKIYIHDSSKDMFYELEDVRSHLREIRDRSVLRLFESADVSGGLPMGGVGIPGGVGHFEDPSYFSEPEFDSEYQHQHIHKSKGSAGKVAPYYMGSTTSLPRSGPILRPYSPAVGALPPDRLKSLPAGSAPPKPQRAYSSGASRTSDGSSRPPDRFVPFQRPTNPLFNLPDGYMSSPERGSRGYEDPYYSQYTSRSGSITPVIDEEVSDTELLDEQYSLYGVKLNSATPRGVRTQFPGPTAAPYDATRLRVEHMERQLANLTGLVQKALTQTPTPRDFLAPPGRDAYRSEKDRLKPAPPPKPASLSPGQYDGRHIYRDLQLTPEMYNQLRGLQKKAKDLRAEVRNLRRMSQAQAHSVKETIRDTFIKIRAMLIAGGEQVWQAGMDQERVRLSRDEDLYKQEMIRLEKDLTDLEASVEELRGNVINRKTRVNMSDVENMALVLSKSSKTVADLKLRFPGLQDSMKAFLTSEMDKVVREEKFLKEEPERLESALRRCKKLTGTLVTLKRLASVQEQRLPCSTNPNDGHISPSATETPPITPTSGQHSKSPSGARMGQISFGGDNSNTIDSNQRPENALDALLDELQTFSKPHTTSTQMPQSSYSDSTPSDPPAIPVKGIPPSHSAHFSHPHMSEIGRKGSMDSAVILPTQNLTVSTATGSLRRLHSYPSGSDTDNSPPIQPLKSQIDGKSFNKPPIPERNAELFQHLSGRRIPPPPPPRTSSKSPLASPTSPSLPPRSPATGLQHIQNVQNMTEKPQSQFEAATQNLGLSTLRRNVPNRSSIKDNKSQTLPRNIGSNLQVHAQPPVGNDLQNVSSSSCESVNSQDGTKKGSRKEELEHRHQELLKKQKALQEQYARLQQLQRGNNTIAVVPPAPDQLLKKTGSESNLLQKMGLQMTATPMTGSLTHLPSTTASSTNLSSNAASASTNINTTQPVTFTTDANTTDTNSNTTTNNKVYETDIL